MPIPAQVECTHCKPYTYQTAGAAGSDPAGANDTSLACGENSQCSSGSMWCECNVGDTLSGGDPICVVNQGCTVRGQHLEASCNLCLHATFNTKIGSTTDTDCTLRA